MRVISAIVAVFLTTSTALGASGKLVTEKHHHPKKQISATITAYTPAPRENGGRGTKSATAIGTRIRPGIVAVSRDLLRAGWKYGSKVRIKGLGVFIIEDTMHRRFHRTIDVAVPNVAAAQRIGKRFGIEVTLLEGSSKADG